MAFWLKYKNGSEDHESMRFEGIKFYEHINVVREEAQTLNLKLYSHLLGARREWDIVISANELFGTSNLIMQAESAGLGYLKGFFNAENQWLCISTADTEPMSGWIHVVIAGGRFPVEFIRGHKYLPQVTVTLRESLR